MRRLLWKALLAVLLASCANPSLVSSPTPTAAPTTDDRRPTTDDRRADRRPTTDDRRPTTDDRRADRRAYG